MNLPMLIYLADILDTAKNASITIIIVTCIVFIITILGWCITNDAYTKEGHAAVDRVLKWLMKRLWILSLVILANILIPSKSTMYLMLGAKYLTEGSIPTRVGEILDLKLKDVLEELKNKAKESAHA